MASPASLNEVARVLIWLTATLKADATLVAALPGGANAIRRAWAPPGTPDPFVIVQFQGGADLNGAGSKRFQTRGVYVVTGVARAENFAALVSVADEIDKSLQRANGTTADGRVLACVREQPIYYSELIDNVQREHLGGSFTAWAQPLVGS